MPRHVCYPFVGDTVGGSHISTLTLVRALPPKRYVPSIVLFRQGPLAEYLGTLQIPYVFASGSFVTERSIPLQMAEMARCAPRLVRFLRARDIDLVHTNDLRMHMTWALAARLAGCGFIWHQRSANDSRRIAVYSRLAHRVVTISNYCRERLPPSMARVAKVVYNPFGLTDGLDRDEARQRLLDKLGRDLDSVVVGFVGNMTWQKRPLVFLEAARQIQDVLGARAVFPMFGDLRAGVSDAVVKRIQALKLKRSVFLMGMQLPIEPWIAACDVLMAPAVNEGFGRALVEAMLVGTPVVAADDGGHREVLRDGETGFLVPPDEPTAFARQVVTLLDRPNPATAIAQAARKHAHERFCVERHVQEITRTYDTLLEARTSA